MRSILVEPCRTRAKPETTAIQVVKNLENLCLSFSRARASRISPRVLSSLLSVSLSLVSLSHVIAPENHRLPTDVTHAECSHLTHIISARHTHSEAQATSSCVPAEPTSAYRSYRHASGTRISDARHTHPPTRARLENACAASRQNAKIVTHAASTCAGRPPDAACRPRGRRSSS